MAENVGLNTMPSQELVFLVQSTTAILFGTYDLRDKLAKANILHQTVKQIFDGDPFLFPIPDNAPNEIPGIVLRSKDDTYQSIVAPNRVEVTYREKGLPTKEPSAIRDFYLGILGSFSTVLRSKWNSTIVRLGLVLELISFAEDPVALIVKNYVREGAIKNPEEIAIHSLSRIKFDELDINRWCRLSSAKTKNAHGERKVLQVVFDLNIVPSEGYSFNEDAIIGFYDKALRHSLDSLNLLFPIR